MTSTKLQERLEQGVQALAALLNYWLARSSLSHDQLTAILDWGMGEKSMFYGGTISRIRNGYQKRGAGLQHLDAMAQGNKAIWAWQVLGEEAAITMFGPYAGWGVEAAWIRKAIWLPKADDEKAPLTVGDLSMLLVGRLELPYVSPVFVTPAEARRMNEGLGRLFDELARERKWSPREALAELLKAYPPTDRVRQQRLKAVVLGEESLSLSELEGELAALAELVRVIRGQAFYSPGDLQAELLSDRPETS